MRIVTAGTTSHSEYFSINDNASTSGGKKTGIAFNTAGLTAYYTRNRSAPVAITLATQTSTGSWSAGGFCEVDGTNAPGLYRLDVPDTAYASGSNKVIVTIKGASGMVQSDKEVVLTAVDLFDAVRAGLTNLDATVSSRLAAASYTAPDNADIATILSDVAAVKAQTDKMAFTVTNKIDANVLAINGDTVAPVALQNSTNTISYGTCSGGTTTTAIASAITNPAALTDAGQLIGRTIIFYGSTGTAGLQAQASTITASTTGSTPTITFTAMTRSPATGDMFVVL